MTGMSMETPVPSGQVINGVVVFDDGAQLPEGTRVRIIEVSKGPSIQPGSGDWQAAEQAARELRESGFDFDAWRQQRDYDLDHAGDHAS
jgi:hypothetical protein